MKHTMDEYRVYFVSNRQGERAPVRVYQNPDKTTKDVQDSVAFFAAENMNLNYFVALQEDVFALYLDIAFNRAAGQKPPHRAPEDLTDEQAVVAEALVGDGYRWERRPDVPDMVGSKALVRDGDWAFVVYGDGGVLAAEWITVMLEGLS